jgi:osmoprotectant transport system substrate-binding protein
MKQIRHLLILSLLTIVVALTTIACNSVVNPSSSSGVITVGSKDFTESLILGEMYASMLENSGLKVKRKFNLGGTPVVQAGLLNGQIDLYPEYTGTSLLTVLKLPSSSNQKQVFETVSQAYKEKFNLVWLNPSPMNNTQALAMTQENAQKYGIKTISDLVAQANKLIMIAPPEFQGREDGLPGLKKVYGNFNFKQLISTDQGLKYQALIKGQADVALAGVTDGEINAFKLVILQDDKKLFPPYQVAPVVRQAALDANPPIRDVLNTLAPKLTDDLMQRLNYEVSGKKREPAGVAQEFLTKSGLLKKP